MSYSESVLTEDYLNKFNELNNPSFKPEYNAESEYTEELPKYNFNRGSAYDVPTIEPSIYDDKDPLNIEKKYQEILRKRKTRGNYPATYEHAESFKAADDQSTIFDDYSNAIQQKKSTIMKDIELERQGNRLRSYSPTGWKMPDAGLISPRENLEHKISELDRLSSIMKRATSEYQQLSHDMEEMRGQLRRQQADIRVSERLAHDNEVKIDSVQNELHEAERKRDQTLRQLELVNEELALKKAKMKNLDTQIHRNMADVRKMDKMGIDREEIEGILAERDELYHLVKKQEEVQYEKYELAKQLDMMRDDFQTETEKAYKQIQFLEDEVEASMRKIKQLQAENEDLQSELHHTKYHLSEAENEICKSSREVAELRGDYQSKIKKKLEEYEMDKERVEKELKKLEQEKTLDQANLKSHIDQIRAELRNTEQERHALQDAVAGLEDHLKQANSQNEQLIREYDEKMNKLERTKNCELEDMKRQLTKEHQIALEEEKIQYGREKNRLQQQCDEEMDHLLKNIEMKEQEICYLQKQLKNAESSFSVKAEEEKSRHNNLLRQEKQATERSLTKKFDEEISKLKDNFQLDMKRKKDELNEAKSQCIVKENEILDLKKKVHDLNQENKRIETDGIIKIRKMKEELVTSLKSRYERKMDEELVKVKNEFEKRQSERIGRHQQEILVMEEHDKQRRLLLNKVVKTVVHEINQECKKMALLLNVQPRKVQHTKLDDDFTKSDNIITQSIANLEACGSETRTLVCELEGQIRKLTEEVNGSGEKFESELRNIRKQLEVEKNKDVSIIREKLMKEHLREISKLAKSPDRGLKSLLQEKEREITRLLVERDSWKESAAEKIADKFEKINQKKVSELRNQLLKKDRELRQTRSIRMRRQRSLSPSVQGDRTSSRVIGQLGLDGVSNQRGAAHYFSQTPLSGGRRLPNNAAKVISNLQESLEELRRENTDLRQRMNGARQSRKDSNEEDGLRLRLSRSCSRSRE